VVRNGIFLACGVIIAGALAWALPSHSLGAPIFWPETIAMEAFALSWLVKGDAHRSLTEPLKAVGRLV
jgi:hypothetical protein